MSEEKWTQMYHDGGSVWAKLVEGNYVEGWHVWAISERDEQGRPWCTRCQDYHHAPDRDGHVRERVSPG